MILTGSQVLVLEFKETAALQQAHVDQVAAYTPVTYVTITQLHTVCWLTRYWCSLAALRAAMA